MNSHMLNHLPQQLGLPLERANRLARDILGAYPACPLGGEYRLAGTEAKQVWRSTAWREGSLLDVHRVPDDYRFPFLHWLRGVDIRFTLSRDTLAENVTLSVKSVGDGQVPDVAGREPDIDGESLRDQDHRAVDRRPFTPGERAVVAATPATLQVGNKTVWPLRRDTPLVVMQVRGDWVGVEAKVSGRTLRGWVRRSVLKR